MKLAAVPLFLLLSASTALPEPSSDSHLEIKRGETIDCVKGCFHNGIIKLFTCVPGCFGGDSSSSSSSSGSSSSSDNGSSCSTKCMDTLLARIGSLEAAKVTDEDVEWVTNCAAGCRGNTRRT
ncbi:Uu.00g051640.m01.CDS01 [Anthostomella pinea]|uniref:Uu.00g051640.m01.CDS01 n=1 Tax=Anthostomella pinea TaxID=933095 RepID=A0AAI8VWT7_9PEZI|nr:Uu.00g051640.m01.CDS01 [Anthostomella pinea]